VSSVSVTIYEGATMNGAIRGLRNGATMVAGLIALLAATAPAPARAAGCEGVTLCTDAGPFTAQLADVRTSTAGRFKVVSTTLRIVNRGKKPLVLGYVVGSGIVTDDQGNRYEIAVTTATGVRGIGLIQASTFDPKFVVPPGDGGDARFEFLWQPGRQVAGTEFEMSLSLREIEPLPGNQFRLGREHLVRFDGLKDRAKSTAAGGSGAGPVATGSAASGTAASAASMAGSAASGATLGSTSGATVAQASQGCGTDANCNDAGPFTATVQQVLTSTINPWHLVRFTLKLRNTSDAPLVLAYLASTGSMTDELGNRYVLDHRVPGRVAGIGVTDRVQADPQFVLRPGEARTIGVEYGRRVGRTQIGTSFSPDLVLQELEILPSRQIRPARDFSLSFRELGTGMAASVAGDAGDRISEAQEATRKITEGLRQLMKPRP
jgi:hypothetical protein